MDYGKISGAEAQQRGKFTLLMVLIAVHSLGNALEEIQNYFRFYLKLKLKLILLQLEDCLLP